MNDENEYVVLRTYRSVWVIDRKFYSLEGIKLPFPVSVNDALYFVVSLFVSYIFIKVIPFYSNLHFVIKYVLIPFGIMKFLTKQKLDGKLPHKFFIDFLMYFFGNKKYEKFKPVESINKIEFSTPILFRRKVIVNKTDIALKNVNNKRK